MTAHDDPKIGIVLQQLGELQHTVNLARAERNAMREELRALKRYVAILVQADLERERSDMNVLVLRDPINADARLTKDGGYGGEENIFRDEWADP